MIKKIIYNLYYYAVKAFTKIKKRVFVCTDNFYDSPKSIYLALHTLFPEYELIWMMPKDKIYHSNLTLPKYIKFKSFNVFKFVKYLCSSFCVINNFEYTWFYKKRKKQFFVQTYHGERGVKKILLDNNYTLDQVRDYLVTDLCVSGSKFGTKKFKSAFNYGGEIIEFGIPRNDELVKGKTNDDLKAKLGIPLDKKVLLYAPTFRDSDNQFNEIIDFCELKKALGEEYVFLIRKHRVMKEIKNVPSFVLDVSDYPDIADILLITDFLITDYSSVAFDFVLTEKPVLLAVFDIESYMSNSRPFMFDLNECGLPIAKNMNELIAIINAYSNNDYAKCDRKALDFFGTFETGESSKEICKRIDNFYKINFR